ncbi:hypothetical protein BDP27DRAFT_1421033 [Rhodocollybia butyracea]|uniref:Uncharacterized protein n=1 Tax=Rhodocollybia butyracea TaxID=206335 RepID=A0A9P5U823_9AGAR|nr:hypothetical protein BDP27DRAFT_1421033 [Rhodocollybia butyracea]
MTPEEVIELSDIGLDLFQNFVEIIIALIIFGIYCLAWCISLSIYWQNSTSTTSAKKAMICALLGTFVLMLLFLGSQAIVIPVLVKYELVVTLPGGIMEQIGAANAETHSSVYDPIHDWVINIIAFIADTVIVWRAWAMWMGNRKVKWTLLLLMLANLAVSVADGFADTDPRHFNQNRSSSTLDWVNFILSFSVNMIATCLISFRAWLHHNSMKSISMITKKRTQGERILLLLVESGAIYAVLQLLCIITSALSVNAPFSLPLNIPRTITLHLYITAAALNPVAIFILVHTKNTYEQSFHLPEISTLSQQDQSNQVSVLLGDPGGIEPS